MEIIQTKTRLSLISTTDSTHLYVHVVKKIDSSGNAVMLLPPYIGVNSSEYTLDKDGLYKVIEIKLPYPANEGFIPTGYFINNGQIYDIFSVTVTVEELLADQTLTEEVKKEFDFISLYLLNEYYLNLIKVKYLQGLCTCGCTTPMEKITVDSLTMGLIIADQLVQNQQYYELQNLVEKLELCTGFISSSNCNCNG